MHEYFFLKIRNQTYLAWMKGKRKILSILFSGTHFWCVSPNDSIFMAKFKKLFDLEEKMTFIFNSKLISCLP